MLLLAFSLAGLAPLLIFGSGFAQHIGKPAANVPVALSRRVIMLLAQITPGNPRQAFFDLFGFQFLRLPPCGGAEGRKPCADMALPLFPGLCPGLALLVYFRLVRTLGSMGVASQSYLRAGIGVVLGLVFLGETFSLPVAVGLCAAIAGVALINWPAKEKAAS